MRHLLLVLLFAICGCASQWDPPKSPAATDGPAAVVERYPIVAGDVEVTIGAARAIIAPPGSATAGSKWIEHAVTYANKSNRRVWVAGYAEANPFCRIETRANGDAEWEDYGLAYCGTGARDFEIPPDASNSFKAALPERYVGQQFRVMVPYRTEAGSRRWVQAASESHRVGRSAGG